MFLRFGLIFLLLALASLLAGYQVQALWLRLVYIWFAVAFLIMALAYLGLGPRVFLKGASGRLHPASLLWLWPVYLLNEVIFQSYRRVSGEPAYVEIVPGLYLGRRLWRREARALGACGVLDLTCEMGETRCLRDSGRYLCLPVLDNTCPTLEQLRQGVKWLGEALRSGPVYVHCAAGHGRSATLVIAYLLASERITSIEEGIGLLKARRPGVRLNGCQRAVLREFARTLD